MKGIEIICALLLLTGSCRMFDSAGSEKGTPPDFLVILERTGCYAAANACPTYEVTIDAAGNVTYVGKDVVEYVGRAEGKATKDGMRNLMREIHRVDFFAKNDSYDAGDPECIRTATDQPSASIRLRMNGREKTVHHYLGCFGADSQRVPRDLIDLQLRIDEVAGTRRWVGKHFERIRR